MEYSPIFLSGLQSVPLRRSPAQTFANTTHSSSATSSTPHHSRCASTLTSDLGPPVGADREGALIHLSSYASADARRSRRASLRHLYVTTEANVDNRAIRPESSSQPIQSPRAMLRPRSYTTSLPPRTPPPTGPLPSSPLLQQSNQPSMNEGHAMQPSTQTMPTLNTRPENARKSARNSFIPALPRTTEDLRDGRDDKSG
jgi:hypothetical protein